eukprot:TRINITY_DN94177_c0_g1_i1.p1 TRINITY_DN94177_c0_g1~~TRINITY_DN94177_c0_g1_i1.p1  ORF type:complete len:217 (+),score=9.25 TRINITY_DN94177_c0_g1_i1:276-926(+)
MYLITRHEFTVPQWEELIKQVEKMTSLETLYLHPQRQVTSFPVSIPVAEHLRSYTLILASNYCITHSPEVARGLKHLTLRHIEGMGATIAELQSMGKFLASCCTQLETLSFDLSFCMHQIQGFWNFCDSLRELPKLQHLSLSFASSNFDRTGPSNNIADALEQLAQVKTHVLKLDLWNTKGITEQERQQLIDVLTQRKLDPDDKLQIFNVSSLLVE